jgi:NAD(P)-dependent dehydrogenase (short-subunit alcohol dehydrogenase family)
MRKVMIVTGASRGIGHAVAAEAARQGFAVCINYARSAGPAEDLAAEIRERDGQAIAVGADVSRRDEVARMFERVDQELGTVTALVNNAGIVAGMHRVDAIDPATLMTTFETNVYGTFYCSGEAIRRMSTARGGKGGTIINISSAAARHGGLPEEVHYAASKGAIDSMTVGLAKEVGKEGIRVVGIRPGLIRTEIHHNHGGEATIQALAPTVPIGREGLPEEIAAAVLWLVSDQASYVTGTTVDVSGGR